MSRWFRFYDDAMNDPKLLRLSDEHHRAWTILLCVASKNGGTLPSTEDIALTLRLKPAKVALWIAVLVKGGLIDNVDGSFAPHNWASRQFKSDGSTERVKRFRNKERNVSCNVSETGTETGPEAEAEQSRAEQTRAVAVSHETKEPKSDDISVRVLKTDLMDAFGGSSKCPDLTRASTWVSLGYAPSMVVEVVRELIARKPDIANLAYFDKALAERHDKRAPTPSERAAGVPPETMDWALAHFAKGGHWPRQAGPEPGLPGCRATTDQLAKHGFGLDGQKLKESA